MSTHRHRAASRAALTMASLGAALSFAAPVVAHAGTVGLADLPAEGGGSVRALLFVANPGEQNSTDTAYGADGSTATFYDTRAGGVKAADGCEQVITAGSVDAKCPTAGVQLIVFAFGDGDDGNDTPNLDRRQRDCPIPIYYEGGAGNDNVTTCKDNDTIADLGPGDDRLWVSTTASVDASLGDGNDTVGTFAGALFGQAGSYDGGAGDDVLMGTTAKETFVGGAGRDRVTFPHQVVTASLDGQANDGPENDHIAADVEELQVEVAGSVALGTDAPNTLISAGAGTILRGLGGDDTLVGSDYGETLEGGSGNDTITGGFGDDTIDGGPGRDKIEGDRMYQGKAFLAGADVIRTRDGEVDTVTCGVGADLAEVDDADIVTATGDDACETIQRAAGSAGSGGPSGNGNPAPGGNANPAGSGARVSIAKTKLRSALKGGLKVKVTGAAAGKVTLTAKKGKTVVARGSAKVGKSGGATITLKFTAAAKRQLGKAGSVKLTVNVTAGGKTTTQTVTVKR